MKQQGFGLLEILIAVFIVAIGVAASGLLLTNTIRTSINSENRSSIPAQIEHYRGTAVTSLPAEEYFQYILPDVYNGNFQIISTDNTDFRMTETIITDIVYNEPRSMLKHVSVTVEWDDIFGSSDYVTLTSAITHTDMHFVGGANIPDDWSPYVTHPGIDPFYPCKIGPGNSYDIEYYDTYDECVLAGGR